MAAKVKIKHGLIDVTNGVITAIVGSAAIASYGVVGMASKDTIRDGVNGILNRANYGHDVVIRSVGNRITVDVCIIVDYGLKTSEVSRNIQDSVEYNLEQQLGIQTKSVNVIVRGIKVLDK